MMEKDRALLSSTGPLACIQERAADMILGEKAGDTTWACMYKVDCWLAQALGQKY
jgi:hypothetical protein